MISEWEGTPWGGSTVAVAEPDKVDQVDRAIVKAAAGPFMGRLEQGSYLQAAARTPQALMRQAQRAYHRNPWIFAAENAVTRKVVGLPWHLEDDQDEEYGKDGEAFPGPVKYAYDLLEKPQANLPADQRDPTLLTRRALMRLLSRHMGLCGVAYIYPDQTDQNGIPAALIYVNPARVWAATTPKGRITGWVLDPDDEYGRGGTPLRLEELIPFYLDPPDSGPYPAGLFERVLLKSQITQLADQHAAYVLGTGGRIAGIVSPKEGTIPEEQFISLVREFRNVNEAPDAAKRTTIVRGPVDFTETGATPDELDLIELSKMNRDDVFTVWGVPQSQAPVAMAAGLNSGGTKDKDESVLMQGPVHDRVGAIRETFQYGLLDRWQATGYTIDLEIEEPEFDDRTPAFTLAQTAVSQPLTNAERRELMGLDPFGDDRDDEVWMPVTQVLAYGPTIAPKIVTPQTPQLGPGEVPAELKGKRQFLGLRKSVDTRWVPSVRKAVAAVLADQQREVAAKVRDASPATLARQAKNGQAWFDKGKEAERLRKALAPVIAGIAEAVGSRTTELLKAADGKADGFLERLLQQITTKVAKRIAGITDTTQDAITKAITEGVEEGLSPLEVARRLEGLPAFDPVRAETVARTETAFAYNAAALDSFGEYGVNRVEAIDGDDDEECASRDGQTFDLEDAMSIEDHPNGTLDWIPVL